MTKVIDAQGHRKSAEVIVKGMIVGFYGSRVPEGWALCDGTNGTPDLTDRMLVGASAVGIGSAGGTESPVSGMVHSGLAVGNHSDHVATQAANHSAHVATQPGAHSAHAATQPADHGTHSSGGAHTHNSHTTANTGSVPVASTLLTGPTTHSSDGGHTHDAHSAHAGWGVDAHSAHSGFGVDAHSAHAGFGVDSHSAHSITQPATHQLLHLRLAWIMKL